MATQYGTNVVPAQPRAHLRFQRPIEPPARELPADRGAGARGGRAEPGVELLWARLPCREAGNHAATGREHKGDTWRPLMYDAACRANLTASSGCSGAHGNRRVPLLLDVGFPGRRLVVPAPGKRCSGGRHLAVSSVTRRRWLSFPLEHRHAAVRPARWEPGCEVREAALGGFERYLTNAYQGWSTSPRSRPASRSASSRRGAERTLRQWCSAVAPAKSPAAETTRSIPQSLRPYVRRRQREPPPSPARAP
jgi:hypothetical protein